jgi:dTMP kinase
MENMFFSVEGLDGSGKTTTTKYMGQYLTERGIPNLVVESYPRDENALLLRDLWIQQKVPDVGVLAIVLQLRARIMFEQIIPALLEGKIVVSDRWHDTTWVYQQHGQGIPHRVMSAVYDHMFNLHRMLQQYGPEKAKWLYEKINGYATVYLDVSLETSRSRVSGRVEAKDAFEKADDEFFLRLKAGFQQQFKDRFFVKNPLFVIDANNDLDYVKQHVRTVLDHTSYPKPFEK